MKRRPAICSVLCSLVLCGCLYIEVEKAPPRAISVERTERLELRERWLDERTKKLEQWEKELTEREKELEKRSR